MCIVTVKHSSRGQNTCVVLPSPNTEERPRFKLMPVEQSYIIYNLWQSAILAEVSPSLWLRWNAALRANHCQTRVRQARQHLLARMPRQSRSDLHSDDASVSPKTRRQVWRFALPIGECWNSYGVRLGATATATTTTHEVTQFESIWQSFTHRKSNSQSLSSLEWVNS